MVESRPVSALPLSAKAGKEDFHGVLEENRETKTIRGKWISKVSGGEDQNERVKTPSGIYNGFMAHLK